MEEAEGVVDAVVGNGGDVRLGVVRGEVAERAEMVAERPDDVPGGLRVVTCSSARIWSAAGRRGSGG